MSELLIGCGNRRAKCIRHDGRDEWTNLVTLDVDPKCNPDVVHDLNVLPYPFEDNQFDEVHAYEVLEHCGRQGDWQFFFAQFDELWRILKPGGLLAGTVPLYSSPWAWADPGHTRVLPQEAFYLLNRNLYEAEIGKTSLTDYRDSFRGNFRAIGFNESEHQLGFLLEAIKE